jgi:hypothetical protein
MSARFVPPEGTCGSTDDWRSSLAIVNRQSSIVNPLVSLTINE